MTRPAGFILRFAILAAEPQQPANHGLIAEQTSVGRERGLQAQLDGAAQIVCAATEAGPGVSARPSRGRFQTYAHRLIWHLFGAERISQRLRVEGPK